MAFDIALFLVVKSTAGSGRYRLNDVCVERPTRARDRPNPHPARNAQDVHNFVAAQQKMH
jgi:hypothetical protein